MGDPIVCIECGATSYNESGKTPIRCASCWEKLKERTEKAEGEVERLNSELEKHRWIPAEERLPEMGEIVLVTEGNGVCEGKREFDFFHKFEWVTVDRFKLGKITHWMPKPEPPNKVNIEKGA